MGTTGENIDEFYLTAFNGWKKGKYLRNALKNKFKRTNERNVSTIKSFLAIIWRKIQRIVWKD